MRIVAQRVSSARVWVEGEVAGEIGPGLCLLVGVGHRDTAEDADRLAEKIVGLRIFCKSDGSGGDGRMDCSLFDVGGAILAVSQFTLYADCKKGRRPSFTSAASAEKGRELYGRFVERSRELGARVSTGVFGADMRLEITNEGPVTVILDSSEI
ncbi:MAG: D-tyrosyl-tRNA(Tyr) deacylase [Synergistaceae bacterium]|jgi:D-tyrosyl-tRNA(Tyr) deacylase|nr:D-tyrosyl-tRNA(Tyr) deacylase [Synergistaceae bacterium]